MTLTQTIAAKVKANASIGLELEAISTLLSLIAKCFFSSPMSTDKTPAEHLQEHFDTVSQTFDSQTINQVYPQTCRAIRINYRKNGGKRLRDYTRIEITDSTNATLLEAMNQPAAVAMAVSDEAPNYEEEDENERSGY